MYQTLGLLKEPLANTDDLESRVQSICTQIGLLNKGLKMRKYGSRKTGLIPVFCFRISARGYKLQLRYHQGLEPFHSNTTKGFVREDYTALFEIYSEEEDPTLEHFDEFLLLCEAVGKEFDCFLIQFNDEEEVWEPYY